MTSPTSRLLSKVALGGVAHGAVKARAFSPYTVVAAALPLLLLLLRRAEGGRQVITYNTLDQLPFD